MGLIENFKEIADLVKKTGNIDLYKKIVELEAEVIELNRKNIELEKEVDQLRKDLSFREKLTFKKPFYYAEGDDTPYCPTCYEKDSRYIHLDGPDSNSYAGNPYFCRACKQSFPTSSMSNLNPSDFEDDYPPGSFPGY